MKIQQHDIRLFVDKKFQRLPGIGGAANMSDFCQVQNPLQKAHVGGLIVNDENAGFLEDRELHAEPST